MFAAAVWLVVGPWPLRRSRRPAEEALAASLQALESARAETPPAVRGPLRAGWAARNVTPDHPVGLYGYGARRRAKAVGVHDELYVRALALDNGERVLLLLTADLLIIPEDLASAVREGLADAGLRPHAVMMAATHTHSAPNPWRNSIGQWISGGAYDEGYNRMLRRQATEAALEALRKRRPARWAAGRIAAEDLVANRARRGEALDHWIEYLALHNDRNERCLLVNFSAHATIMGPDNLFVSADYPGFLCRAMESDGRSLVLFQAGAAGSTRPLARETDDPEAGGGIRVYDAVGDSVMPDRVARRFARAEAYGRALAQRIESDAGRRGYRDDLLLDELVFEAHLPPLQVRLTPGLRLSPLAARRAGLPSRSRVQALRIDHLLLVGLGVEVSGEVSRVWKAYAREKGFHLWVASFTTDYLGYLSPDHVFDRLDKNGRLPYETGLMSWLGPHAAFYFTGLIERLAETHAAPGSGYGFEPDAPGNGT